jgi:dipeptidyl aminopeptidase/acylaminoacyl peptidase
VGNVAGSSSTPFDDLGDYMAIPRVGALRLSPDGTWLAATVQTLSPDRKKFLTSIWRIDPQGGQARRLTRSAEGEGSPAFLPNGDLLFISKRPDPDASQGKSDDAMPGLWLLPATGGEATVIGALPGGIAAVTTARDEPAIVVSAQVMPVTATTDEEGQLRKERKDAGVTAILHESAPIRYWDHDLGPAQLRLYSIENAATAGQEQPRDLTPEPGRALDEQAFELTPDGTRVITGWWNHDPAAGSYIDLVEIDVATGQRRTLLTDKAMNFDAPKVSPDGRFIVCQRETLATADTPTQLTLVLKETGQAGQETGQAGQETGQAGQETGQAGQARDLLPDLDRWPSEAIWAPDSTAIFFTADDNGRCPVFKVDVRTGETERLTAEGAYLSLSVDPQGRYLYALRTAIDEPPTPVRIDLTDTAGGAQTLECPGVPLALPGRVEELETTADDGQLIRSWLVLPRAAGNEKAPLLLWVHGGPNSSWNAWSWRWNPWLMAAKGYAVLLPDPALSTGYGQHMLQRGHRTWAATAFEDVMKATDGAIARDDIDETRTAMMGGSYGGYMANWIAGHTDRFKAIVSHASLWALDQMFTTTDVQMFWWGQFGDPLTHPGMYETNSPHLHIKNISTPMLVIHGDKDYRVPIGEALRLWGELTRHAVEAKFLYFPDEGHWILSPGNATIWYETVHAFLAQHVHDEPWQRPKLI